MSSNNSCPISIYPIPPLILKQLHNKGYRTTGSVIGLRPSELSTSEYTKVKNGLRFGFSYTGRFIYN